MSIILVPLIFLFVVIFGITARANVFVSFVLDTMIFNIEQRMKATAQRQKLYEFAEASGILYAFYTRAVDGKAYYIVDNDYDLKTQAGLDTKPFDLAQAPWIGGLYWFCKKFQNSHRTIPLPAEVGTVLALS